MVLHQQHKSRLNEVGLGNIIASLLLLGLGLEVIFFQFFEQDLTIIKVIGINIIRKVPIKIY